MPPQFTHGIPKSNDPVVLAEWIVKHQKKVAPIDLLQLGVFLIRDFGGMKSFATQLRKLADDKNLPPRDRMRVYELTLSFLQKTSEIYPRPVRAHDLTPEQIAACIRYAHSLADSPGRVDDPGDAFGD